MLFGMDGNDQLLGSQGDDDLFGDAGDDQLSGEDGADIINGGDGNDQAFGGSGDDRFFAGGGNDQIFGEEGNDTADGEAGDDTLNGGKGNDTLFGSLGNDSLIGGEGQDVLVSGVGSDAISGGCGDDVLVRVDPFVPEFGFGGTPNNPLAPFEKDTLTGGQGRDTFALGDNGTVLGIERGEPELYYFGGGNEDFALITDFNIGQDTIQLASDIFFNDLEFGISDGNSLPQGVTISFEGDLIAVIEAHSLSGMNNSANFMNA
ncbi:MAG TPA: hypothetical protein DCE56_19080 [Cyanobacteria bacterium UBA8553]|nr:hypothetical protein [Cyanobacteria bacterium UBA8553]